MLIVKHCHIESTTYSCTIEHVVCIEYLKLGQSENEDANIWY